MTTVYAEPRAPHRSFAAPLGWRLAIVPTLAAVLVAVLVFAQTSPLGDSGEAQAATVLTVLQGEVLVETKDGIKAATNGMRLEENDRVITSAGARAVLTFFDGSTVTLEPDTVLVIRSVEQKDEHLVAQLSQEQGRTWTHVPEGLGPADVTIETPNAAAGTQSTGTFETAVADGRTEVVAGSGPVSVQSGSERAEVPTGSRSTVDAPGSVTQPSAAPQALRELVVRITGADYAHVVDPSGATVGVVAPGVPVNQVSGASLSNAGGSIVLRIPEPLNGAYRLSARSEDDSAIAVEAVVRDGGNETAVASFKAGAKETWQVGFAVSGYEVEPQAVAREPQPVAPAVIPDAAIDKAQQNATPAAARPTQTPSPTPTQTPTAAPTKVPTARPVATKTLATSVTDEPVTDQASPATTNLRQPP